VSAGSAVRTKQPRSNVGPDVCPPGSIEMGVILAGH